MIRLAVLCSLVARILLAAGGDTGGNGGDLVVCARTAGSLSYEILDYFEAVQSTPFDLGPKHWSASEKVSYALHRLVALDPTRVARYEIEARTFLARVDWITQGPGLEHIADLGEVKIPTHCKVQQIAIRRKTFHPSIKPFLIDQRLWNKLDEDHRAGLILHEIIWGEMRDLGQKTSINARKYNGLLSSAEVNSMAKSDYDRLARTLFQEIQPVAFRADKFDINVLQNEAFSIGLRSLLQYPVKGPLQWHLLDRTPSWMVLDPAKETLSGIPGSGEPDPILIKLVVHDGDTGAVAQLRIHVK